jgi:SDR family mycofactocin-dependent oxidoreductase
MNQQSKPISRRRIVIAGSTVLAGATAAAVTSTHSDPAIAQTSPAAPNPSATGRLADKVAIVTGAGRGIGRATAVAFAREGADVVAIDIAQDIPTAPYPMASPADLSETERLVQAEGRQCLVVQADVRDIGQMRQAVDRAIQELGKVDILFANAGIATMNTPLLTMNDNEWRDVLEVNLFGVANVIRAVLPHMVEQQTGSIVANSSIGGRMGTPGVANYGAAKWGIIGLVKAAAIEVGKSGVRVNAVCPTFVNTMMTERGTSLPGMPQPTLAELEQVAQQAHALNVGIIEPEEVAAAVVFLVSDEARYLTGGAIDVGAGSNARWSA